MKKHFVQVFLLALSVVLAAGQDSKPLRIFIRAGTKTHGPGQHDHPRFLKEWTELLNQRGAKTTGKIGFPTAEELENTDVLLMYSEEAGTIVPEDRANLDKFLKRGGGIVAIHDSVCGTDSQWFKTVIGGAWEHGKAKWLEGDVGMYFVDTDHPITRGRNAQEKVDSVATFTGSAFQLDRQAEPLLIFGASAFSATPAPDAIRRVTCSSSASTRTAGTRSSI